MGVQDKDFKGTDGNWQVLDEYDIDNKIKIWNGDEQAHAPIMQTEELGDLNYFEAFQNAKLIAKAPELLNAVRHAVTGLVWKFENEPMQFDKADGEKLEEWKELLNQILYDLN